MSKTCLSFQENFYYPEFSAKLQQEGGEIKCMKTGRTFEPLALTLAQRNVTLVNNFTYL